jgi:hypothetical protein
MAGRWDSRVCQDMTEILLKVALNNISNLNLQILSFLFELIFICLFVCLFVYLFICLLQFCRNNENKILNLNLNCLKCVFFFK